MRHTLTDLSKNEKNLIRVQPAKIIAICARKVIAPLRFRESLETIWGFRQEIAVLHSLTAAVERVLWIIGTNEVRVSIDLRFDIEFIDKEGHRRVYRVTNTVTRTAFCGRDLEGSYTAFEAFEISYMYLLSGSKTVTVLLDLDAASYLLRRERICLRVAG